MERIQAQSLEPYEEPTVEDVPLDPDERMLANCKGNGSSRGSGPSTTCVKMNGTPCRNS